ncbi:MAG TPA: cadherin-like beta sandwich domain-containing protein [Spirochaetota bacterium]|nr:cadherin-like beta sandwich domain-containing protein [Spirochaetota bacterium]
MRIGTLQKLIFPAILCSLLSVFSCDDGTNNNEGNSSPDQPASASADLESLELSLDGLDPEFSPSVVSYSVTVSLESESLTFTPAAADPDAAITVNGSTCASGDVFGPFTLNLGENMIEITVTATDGSEKTYTIEVVRGLRQRYIKASNTGADDEFGYSISLYGDTLAVGAYGEDSDATGIEGDQSNNNASASGAVYIFTRTGSTWAQQAYIKTSNAEYGDQFGYAVALYGDTLAVGAHYEDSAATGIGGDQDDNSAEKSGAVYVFTRTGSTWTQQAYIKASNTGTDDRFGCSVSLYEDTLVAGAYREDSPATGINGVETDDTTDASASGAVYVFTRTGSTWAQQAYIKASNSDGGDNFGLSVSLYGDTLAVGAMQESSAAAGIGGDQDDDTAGASGAVYVFTRTDSTWAQQAYIKASNTGASDYFGSSVALHGDTLAVGAHFEDSAAAGIGGDQDDDTASASGAVYVFTRTGSTWAQQAYIKASNTGANDYFGLRIALNGDTLAVGAYAEDSTTTGIDGEQSNSDASASGAAYVFTRTGDDWEQQAYVKAPNTDSNDQFGWSLALYGDSLAIGAHYEASAATGIDGDGTNDSVGDSGAVYLYYDTAEGLW